MFEVSAGPPDAPRWTSSPAAAPARPGTRKATSTSARSPGIPPSRPARPRPARYRKIARRRGKNKACVALGNTQLKVYHKLLSNPGMRCQDLGPDYCQHQAVIRRKIAYHVRELETLDLEVTLCCKSRPDPEPGSAAPAA